MTQIVVEKDSSDYMVSLNGHAGYAPKGHDLVCAAISLLTTMIAQTLLNDEKVVTHKCEMGDGTATFSFTAQGTDIDARIDTIVTGFKLLHQEFPQYVNLILNGF